MLVLDNNRNKKNLLHCEKLQKLAENANHEEKEYFAGSDSIPASDASRMIRNFVNSQKSLYEVRLRNPIPYEEKEDIIGFLFDLETIANWVKRITDYNNTIGKDPKKRIDFIRIYNCQKEVGPEDFDPDVFFIPVRSNGEDFYTVYKAPQNDLTDEEIGMSIQEGDPDDLICNNSIPCPNQC